MTMGKPQAINPFGAAAYEDGMKAALQFMLTGEKIKPAAKDAGLALRFVKDRISAPHDMSVWAAMHLKQACIEIAEIAGVDESRVIPIDQEWNLEDMVLFKDRLS